MLKVPYVNEALESETVKDIGRIGLRNSHLLAIAPTGSLSPSLQTMFHQVLNLYFLMKTNEKVLFNGGEKELVMKDYAYDKYGFKGSTASEVSVDNHVAVLARSQKWIDQAVSKTVNHDSSTSFEEFKDLYKTAYTLGCKGLSTFNSDGKRMGIMKKKEDKESNVCEIDPLTGQKSCS